MNLNEIKKLTRFGKQMGAVYIKNGDFEIHFQGQTKVETQVEEVSTPISDQIQERPLTDDELLLLSTPFFDQLRADRAEGKESA